MLLEYIRIFFRVVYYSGLKLELSCLSRIEVIGESDPILLE